MGELLTLPVALLGYPTWLQRVAELANYVFQLSVTIVNIFSDIGTYKASRRLVLTNETNSTFEVSFYHTSRMDKMKLDEIDRNILYYLQQNARENTATFIGEKLGVTGTTISNRIDQLKETGVIRSFHPVIDYEQAGFDLRALLIGRGVKSKGTDVMQRALNVHGVISIQKMLAEGNDLHIEVVARSTPDLERITDEVANLGMDILHCNIIKDETTHPCNTFFLDKSGEAV